MRFKASGEYIVIYDLPLCNEYLAIINQWLERHSANRRDGLVVPYTNQALIEVQSVVTYVNAECNKEESSLIDLGYTL